MSYVFLNPPKGILSFKKKIIANIIGEILTQSIFQYNVSQAPRRLIFIERMNRTLNALKTIEQMQNQNTGAEKREPRWPPGGEALWRVLRDCETALAAPVIAQW